MKHLLPYQSHYGFTALVLLCMLQLTAYRADAQEQTLNINVNNTYNNINVTGNQSLNNRNVISSVPTGPNGPGGVRAMTINMTVIDNGTGSNTGGGPNVRGYTSSLISNQRLSNQSVNKPKTTRPASVQAAKPKRVVAATPTIQRPKPNTTTAAPRRRVTRPAAPVVVAPVVAAPLPVQVQAPVSNPVIGTGNESPVVEQMMNDDNNVAQSNVMSNNVSAPVISTVSAPAMRSSAVSSGSGSSGKSHRSGRKKHGSFYYTANKKMIKLFAKTKGRKFDPAKCFVWK